MWLDLNHSFRWLNLEEYSASFWGSLSWPCGMELTTCTQLLKLQTSFVPMCNWTGWKKIQRIRTLCEVLWWNHSRSVTKNLTPHRFNSAGWGLDDQKTEIHSFPTMYNTWGCLLGRNGSKQWFSPKKWSKNSFFEGHKFGSTDFGGVLDSIFWRHC